MKKLLLSAAAVVLAATVAAVAANTTFFTSVGDVIFPMSPTTIGDATRGGMAPVNGSGSYVKAAPLTGFSLTFGNYQQDLALNPSGTLALGYVTMAPAPVDGGRACVFSTEIITLLYVNPNSGQSINDAITALAANAHACYIYSKSNTTWDRYQ